MFQSINNVLFISLVLDFKKKFVSISTVLYILQSWVYYDCV